MRYRANGFTLIEVMLALALSALVLGALLVVVQGVNATLRNVQALDLLSSSARYLQSELSSITSLAGAADDPVQDDPISAVAGSRSGEDSDLLSLQTMSSRNCFENENPVRDPDGEPAWWLQRNEFEVRDGRRLVRSCYYGPPGGPAIRQLNAATLVEGVEHFRLRFAIDTSGDRRLDDWVHPGNWSEEASVIGVRVGIILATEQPVGAEHAWTLSLFGQPVPVPADGLARIATTLTLPIRSRL